MTNGETHTGLLMMGKLLYLWCAGGILFLLMLLYFPGILWARWSWSLDVHILLLSNYYSRLLLELYLAGRRAIGGDVAYISNQSITSKHTLPHCQNEDFCGINSIIGNRCRGCSQWRRRQRTDQHCRSLCGPCARLRSYCIITWLGSSE